MRVLGFISLVLLAFTNLVCYVHSHSIVFYVNVGLVSYGTSTSKGRQQLGSFCGKEEVHIFIPHRLSVREQPWAVGGRKLFGVLSVVVNS